MLRDAVDKSGLTRYTQAMPKRAPDAEGEEHLKLLGVKIPAEVLTEIERIKTKEKRTKSQVGAFLLIRGLNLYNHDGQLIEGDEQARKRR